MKKALVERFERNVEGWKAHCKENAFSSSVPRYLDCGHYRGIVSMGNNALPLIRKLYDESAGIHDLPAGKLLRKAEEMTKEQIEESEKYLPLAIIKGFLCSAVKEIVGEDFEIPDRIRGVVLEMEIYTKDWLDENMNAYVSKKK